MTVSQAPRRTTYKSERPIIVTEKACSRCKEVKPAAAYRPNHRMAAGLDTYCRPCNAAKGREWKAANPKRNAELALRRAPRTTMERRKLGLWVNYRMTWDDYQTRLQDQGGVCAVCYTADPVTKSGTFYIDHDHSCCSGTKSCGKCVRGLLCSSCNMGIGQMGDDPQRLMSAAKYLTK